MVCAEAAADTKGRHETSPINRSLAMNITRWEPAENRLPIESMAAAVAESHAAERRAMIADAAYFRAERRRFEPGHVFEDWLAA